MSRCITDACNQGRESCPTPAACFGAQNLHRVMHIPLKREEADAPEDFTQERTFGAIDLARSLVIAVTVAIVAALVTANWPLFVWAAKGMVP